MVRSALGVVVGAVLWMVGFYTLATVLAQFWPDYATHGRQWVRQDLFTFTRRIASSRRSQSSGEVIVRADHEKSRQAGDTRHEAGLLVLAPPLR